MSTIFTDKNGFSIDGSAIKYIYFYNNGIIEGYTRPEIKENQINGNYIKEQSHFDYAENITLNSEIKKAIKLNLFRKDIFYIKNPEKSYKYDKEYNLYINTNLINFSVLGDFIRGESERETNYLRRFKRVFDNVTIKKYTIEKIENSENYKLSPGEVFGDFYGEDKKHRCIKHIDGAIFHPEKNINYLIKKYIEYESFNNYEIIITQPYYIKTELSEKWKKCIELSNRLKKEGVTLSSYAIETLYKNGFEIIERK